MKVVSDTRMAQVEVRSRRGEAPAVDAVRVAPHGIRVSGPVVSVLAVLHFARPHARVCQSVVRRCVAAQVEMEGEV
jgi:hypothetical protein